MANPIEARTARDAFAVTPSDTTVIATGFRALYVGGTGAVAIRTLAGNTVTFAAVPAGTTLLVAGDQVRATGTTATDIVGMTF